MKIFRSYDPGKIICVDESLIPFQSRIILKQYIKQNRHKQGIQIFKLCAAPESQSLFKFIAERSRCRKNDACKGIYDIVLKYIW